MDPAALSQLEPGPVVPNVDLTATFGVGVHDLGGAPPGARQNGLHEEFDHAQHVPVSGVWFRTEPP